MLMLAITRVGTTLGIITPHTPLTDPYTPEYTPVTCQCKLPTLPTCYTCTFLYRIHTNASALRWQYTIKHPKSSIRRQNLQAINHNSAPVHRHNFRPPTQQDLQDNLELCRHPPHQLSEAPPRNTIKPRELSRIRPTGVYTTSKFLNDTLFDFSNILPRSNKSDTTSRPIFSPKLMLTQSLQTTSFIAITLDGPTTDCL